MLSIDLSTEKKLFIHINEIFSFFKLQLKKHFNKQSLNLMLFGGFIICRALLLSDTLRAYN